MNFVSYFISLQLMGYVYNISQQRKPDFKFN